MAAHEVYIFHDNGTHDVYTGPMPTKEDLMEANSPLQLCRAGEMLWVRFPKMINTEFLKSIPGSSWDGWAQMYALESKYLMRLLANMHATPELRALEYWPPAAHPLSLAMEVEIALGELDRAEAFRLGNMDALKEVPAYLTYGEFTPRLFQYQAAEYLKAVGRAILALPMGVGKTATIISTIKLMRRYVPIKSLVVCPASAKELVWEKQLKEFSSLQCQVVMGPPNARDAAYETFKHENKDVLVTSPEIFKKDFEYYTQEAGNFSLFIVDEAQKAGSTRTEITKKLGAISKLIEFLILSTGTPVMNDIMELYSLCVIVDDAMFRSERDYKLRYMPRDEAGAWIRHGVKNLEELKQRVHPIMFLRTPEDIADQMPTVLPPVLEAVELDEDQRKLYDNIRAEAKGELHKYQDAEGRDRWRIVKDTLAIITRLRQVCCEPGMITGNFSTVSPKLQRLTELLDTSLQNDKVLVFTQFASITRHLQRHLAKNEIQSVVLSGNVPVAKRKPIVEQFEDDPTCKVIILTTAGGTALNLRHASAVVNYDLLWNPKMMDQIAARAIRMDSISRYISITTIISRGTVEEKMLALLERKAKLSDAIMSDEQVVVQNTSELYTELLELLG